MVHYDTHHLITIRLRLIAAREKAGFSQGMAARTLGIARPTLGWIESGQQTLRVPDLLAMCELYGTTPAEVLRPGYEIEDPGAAEKRRRSQPKLNASLLCLSCAGRGFLDHDGNPTSSKGGIRCSYCKGSGNFPTEVQ